MKDIFIDNNIASRFKNPADIEYIKLKQWLLKNHEKESDNAFLVVSNKLLNEYNRSNQHTKDGQNIAVIISILQKQGRLVFIRNQQINNFKAEFFTKKVIKNFKSNNEDRDHIPIVLLSERKYALSIDDNFITDLLNFPGFIVLARKRPEEVPYQ